MEEIQEAIAFTGKVVVFILLTVIFIPAFLIVNSLQKPWSDMMGKLFKS